MIKIDLAKAFDRIEWHFIVAALARKGLDGHFIKLIHACIATPFFLLSLMVSPMLGLVAAEVFGKVVLCPPLFLFLQLTNSPWRYKKHCRLIT
jgi:hypothetical protein